MEPTRKSEPPGRGPSEELDVELGYVTGVFGFRGEVRLHLHNPTSGLLRDPREVVLVAPDGAHRRATLSARPGAGNRVIGRILGVADEAGAAALKDHRVWIAKAALPALDPDEYYVWQLVGCRVQVGDRDAGEVRGVQTAGPYEILEILGVDGVEHFVPARREFVLAVRPDEGRIELAPGALDED